MRGKPKAKLYLRFRTPDAKQSPFCPALFDHKFRIRPFWCLVKGVEELRPDGTTIVASSVTPFGNMGIAWL
jgi:hypothetical protein